MNPITDKPVATTGLIGAVAAGVEAYAEHRGWIPASAAPIVIAATVGALATVAHELVAPWKKVKQVVENGLHLTDADFGRVDALLEQYGLEMVARYLPPDPVSPSTPEGVIPSGMSAGAPVEHAPEHAAPLVTGTAAPAQTPATRPTQGDFVPPATG
jgi:hypothetical protein